MYMPRISILRFFIILTGSLLFFVACEVDPERKKKERAEVISHYVKLQTDSIKIELDSICKIVQVENFEHFVDSVLEARIAKMKAQIEPYRK